MTLKPRTWFFFLGLAVVGTIIWFKLGYPLFNDIDLSVDRNKAQSIAKDYLTSQFSVDISQYQTAVIFIADRESDRYLQKTLGFEKEKEFLKKYDLEIFMWMVRFFQEGEKEEFLVIISSRTGEVITLKHIIDETAARPDTGHDTARKKLTAFLAENFAFDPEQFTLKEDSTRELDNRKEYSFSWYHNNVYIPWSSEPDTGGAQLLTGGTISGGEILSFSKFNLKIPEEYSRQFESKKGLGLNLLTVIRILYTLVFVGAVFFLILRRNHLATHTTRNFYIGLAAALFIATVLAELNYLQAIIMGYDTTQTIRSFFGRHFIDAVWGIFFGTIGILMPSLSGEALHYEVLGGKKEGSFLHYLRTTFFSREVFKSVIIGYWAFVILLAGQALIFDLGQKHWGVWLERTWVIQFSSAYFPFFAAFVLGIKASFFEEITFRLFAISWFKRIFKNLFVAVFFSALIWGFGHSGYLVFPMWFRGMEVTLMGLFFSYVYLQFGIIPVIVAHYAFDVFWSSTGYLLGKSEPFYFYSSLGVFCLPLIFGIVSFLLNKDPQPRTMRWQLNKHQEFNLGVLKAYIKQHAGTFAGRTKAEVRREIISHGWDIAVVDMALEDFPQDGA